MLMTLEAKVGRSDVSALMLNRLCRRPGVHSAHLEARPKAPDIESNGRRAAEG